MSGQANAAQVAAFFDNLKESVLKALWRNEKVSIEIKHVLAPSFSPYDTEPVWMGSRFIIEVPRPGEPGQVEAPLMVNPEADHG